MEQIGRYKVVEELGRGGVGIVYRAEDPVIGRQVAIKVIHLDTAGSPAEQQYVQQSLRREMRSAGILNHPRIVRVFDVERQDSFAYIVMELIEGRTLDDLLRARPQPDLATLFRICRQTASALDYAHSQGIVHRDVKPANILVAHDNTAKVADFGVARFCQSSTLVKSQTGFSVGTPDYMSPEQITAKPLDGRADQWSLAVVAYVILTGSKPFAAGGLTDVLRRILTNDPVPPRELNPALRPEIDGVIAKALAKNPEQRYQTCMQFIDALEGACLPKAEPVVQVQSTVQVQSAAPASAPAEPPKRILAGRKRIAAGVAGLLMFGVTAAVVLNRTPRSTAVADLSPVNPQRAAAPAQVQKPAAEPAAVKTRKLAVAASHHTQAAVAAVPPQAETRAVQFETVPAGADIFLDDHLQPACKSPCSAELSTGHHRVTARKDGYQMASRDLDTAEDQQVAITLAEITGQLLVETTPPGAKVAVNSTARAETTPATLRLSPGKYKVTLTKDGFDPYDYTVEVLPEGFQHLRVTLAKSAGH